MNIRRILFPTDFSGCSIEAAGYARAFAEQFDAELHLFHVLEVHLNPTPVFGAGLALPSHSRESKQVVEQELSAILDQEWRRGRRIVHATGEGPPVEAIIGYASEHGIDMIVMGTHGRSGVSHLMMGSVAERIVRESSCPVLTVRPRRER